MRREPVLAALLCLLGACLVLVSAGRDWVLAAVGGNEVLGMREIGVSGTELSPGVQALGLVALAGVVAVAATRSWGRVAVGLVLLVVGAGVVALVAGALSDVVTAAQQSRVVRDAGGMAGESPQRTLWPFACGLGGLTVAAAGLLVAGRGRRWSALGRRYDAPTATPAPVGEGDLWAALDRGEDPTSQDPPGSGTSARD